MIVGVDASRALVRQVTGTERYSLAIVRHLLALPTASRHTWRLYVPEEPPPDLFGDCPANVKIRVLPAARLWTHRALAWEVVRRPPDVLFIPAHVIPFLPPILLPPAVVTIHDLGYRYVPAAHTRSQRLYLEISTRWSAAVARRVIAVSQFTADDLTRFYGVQQTKIRVIHEAVSQDHGVKTQRRRGAETQRERGAGGQGREREREGTEGTKGTEADSCTTHYALRTTQFTIHNSQFTIHNSPYVLYLGTIQPRKNLARLIDAYARLLEREQVNWDLVLAGKRGWLSDELYAAAAQRGIAGRVHFPGYVPAADVPDLLGNALFFAFPSCFEGFGLPVLEAQQMGVPVMCANNSALPEVAGDAAILVDPTDVEAIADAMLRLSQDEALRQTLIAAGYENVKRFSWEKAARETLAVLEEAAKRR